MELNLKWSPELHGGDVAHAPQQGSLAQPAGDVASQLGLCLWRQAAVQQGEAGVGQRDQQLAGTTEVDLAWPSPDLCSPTQHSTAQHHQRCHHGHHSGSEV